MTMENPVIWDMNQTTQCHIQEETFTKRMTTWIWKISTSSFLFHPDQLWGTPSLLLNGYQGFFPVVKWLERDVYHSTPSSAEVKNVCNYTSTPPYTFMAWTGTLFFLFEDE